MEEQFNREAKEGWRMAAYAAIITDERASSEDRKHTSGVVDSNLGTVGPGNEGRITQAWVNVQGGMRLFSRVLLLDPEERSPAGGSVKASQSYPDILGWWHVTLI